MLDLGGRTATPRTRSRCSSCGCALVAKCGELITWHWAHEVAEWGEPETEWHRRWKLYMRDEWRAQIEVPMGPHRADAILPDGRIIELQAGFLSPREIETRERFYGHRLRWLYRCRWTDRLHYGPRGFWWKRGAMSMTRHARRIWWDMGDGEMLRVSLSAVERGNGGKRIVGTVRERSPAPLVLGAAP